MELSGKQSCSASSRSALRAKLHCIMQHTYIDGSRPGGPPHHQRQPSTPRWPASVQHTKRVVVKLRSGSAVAFSLFAIDRGCHPAPAPAKVPQVRERAETASTDAGQAPLPGTRSAAAALTRARLQSLHTCTKPCQHASPTECKKDVVHNTHVTNSSLKLLCLKMTF